MSSVVTSAMIQELRQKTQAGMLLCKKALDESGGDMQKAMEFVAKAGHVKAAKSASRVAAEGIIAALVVGQQGLLLEVNSETDFVARDQSFNDFCKQAINAALSNNVDTAEALLASPFDATMSVEEARTGLVARIGENLQVRRLARMSVTSGKIASYVHLNRIGVIVHYDGPESLGKDLAMQVAASQPEFVRSSEVPADRLDSEKRIFMAQAEGTGKPPAVIEKMMEGRLKKWAQEVSLVDQPYFKNPDQSIQQVIDANKGAVYSFVRYQVGEGIVKEDKPSFAEEVQAQASRGS
ncbi:MAG: translation elongation factor Ts [Pseudomonadota bacterium]